MVIIDDLSNSSLSVLDRIVGITGIKPVFEKIDLKEKKSVTDFFINPNSAGGTYVQYAGGGNDTSISQYLKVNTPISGNLEVDDVLEVIFSGSDKYGNTGSLSKSFTVGAKPAPTLTFNDITANQSSSTALAGTTVVEVTASDPNTILSFDDLVFIPGGDEAKLGISASAGSVGEKVYYITASQTLAGNINFTVSTNYEGFETGPVGGGTNNLAVTESHNFDVESDFSMFVYALDKAGTQTSRFNPTTNFTYNSYMSNSLDPGASGFENTILGKLASGSIGLQSFSGSGLTNALFLNSSGLVSASLLHSGSMLLSSSFSESLTGIQDNAPDIATDLGENYTILILYPSASSGVVNTIPTSYAGAYNGTDFVASVFDTEASFAPNFIAGVRNSSPQNLPISGSYTTYYGTIADTYTTWSYVHLITNGGFTLDNVKIFVAKIEPS